MGRRSINTTKSGKYMNPTDQARKEARKRELKKNKKQRQMVRAAVLKGKDPLQIIQDMEKIDEMEYCVMAPPLLNEKVLRDKRKKLKETWDRVMRLYSKEDRERFVELKKLELEYDSRRNSMMRFFESVRVAQQVQIDEIPLPSLPDLPEFLTSQIPLPNELEIIAEQLNIPPPASILKKSSAYFQKDSYDKALQPPGVPPGPPPDLSSDEDDEDEEEVNKSGDEEMDVDEGAETKATSKSKSRKIRFADEGGDKRKDDDSDDEDDDKAEKEDNNEKIVTDTSVIELNKLFRPEDIPVPPIHSVPLPSGPPPRMPHGPPPMLFRAAAARPGLPRLMPPGIPPPPPGRPTLPPPILPLRLGAPPMRLPPGPPPGMPPLRLLRPPTAVSLKLPATQQSESASTAVVSAPPSLMQRPKHGPHVEDSKHSATIEAKPQIRNLSADVMRFMPTTLRVKREDRNKKGAKGGNTYESSKDAYPTATPVSNPSASAPTKDDAYQQFLREMEELL